MPKQSICGLTATLLIALFCANLRAAPDRHLVLGNDTPEVARRLISFWNVGGGPDGEFRLPGYMRQSRNWTDFVENKVKPEYEWGCRRWLIHNPFGAPAEGPMAFDQYLLAKERGIHKVTGDFVPAWKAFLRHHPDVEVIFYLGKLHSNPRFDKHLPARPDLWLERALESTRPILALNGLDASIAFDAASGAPAGQPTQRFIQLVKSLNVRTYIESWPHKTNAHWASNNIICAERRRGVFALDGAGVARDKITGEIVWLVNANLVKQRSQETDFDLERASGTYALTKELLSLDQHYSVAAPVRTWMEAELSLDELKMAIRTRGRPDFGKHPDGTIVIREPRQTIEKINEIADQIPPVTYSPPADRWQHLERTRELLQNGPELRIVNLGDSIMNDTSSSGWVQLLDQAYPDCDVKMTTVVRGSTGCDWYQHEGRVAKYVLPWNPDLVVIGGISNKAQGGIRNVIQQIRSGTDAEILVLSGSFGSKQDPCQPDYRANPDYRSRLKKLTREMDVAYFDLRSAWADYMRQACNDSSLSVEDFKRDVVHANDKGKQVLGRLMFRHFNMMQSAR